MWRKTLINNSYTHERRVWEDGGWERTSAHQTMGCPWSAQKCQLSPPGVQRVVVMGLRQGEASYNSRVIAGRCSENARTKHITGQAGSWFFPLALFCIFFWRK